jgi:UDP-galactopyranose mutase
MLALSNTDEGVLLAVPHLAPNTPRPQAEAALRRMANRVLAELGDARAVLWYCTPMAVGFTDHLESSAIVYDCTEAPKQAGSAPAEWIERERWLFEHADVVFTDSHSLCRHKRRTMRRSNIYPMLSSVDLAHFECAREQLLEPADQDELPRPRVGFLGVIDERVDVQLLGALASTRPDLQFVMVGPFVSLDPTTLPQNPNLHWLGAKPKDQLLAYLAGWDVAMLPLVCNDATQFMSPSKTAEYLAAGKPVVSTPIPNVVEPFGRDGLAWIGDNFGEFADAIDDALSSDRHARVSHADGYLADHSWQATWDEMWTHVERAMASRPTTRNARARRAKPVGASYSVATAQR